MENPDKSTARVECWNDLRDEKSTESHDKLYQTLTTRSVKNADLTVLLQRRLKTCVSERHSVLPITRGKWEIRNIWSFVIVN